MNTQEINNVTQDDEVDIAALMAAMPDDEDLSALEELEEPEEIEALDGEIIEAEVVEDDAAAEPLDNADLQELDLILEVAASYDDQSGAIPIQSTAPVAGTPPTRGRPRKAATSTGTPAAKDLSSVPASFFVLTGLPADMTDDELEAAKLSALALAPSQKKVREKMDNLFLSLAAGRLPSSYTVTAFRALDHMKTVTVADLVTALKAAGAGDGTARAQAGQMMSLLPMIGVTDKAGKNLNLLPESTIAARLRQMLVATTA